MPPATHRLTLHLLPADPDRPGTVVSELLERLRSAGMVVGEGPGPVPMVDGGFARVVSSVFDGPRFVSNWQGGFTVRCPLTGDPIVAAFNRALEGWRAGGPRRVACPCGREHDLAELDYRPPAGFARGWLALVDVASADLTPDAHALAERVLGGVRVVGRRG